MALTRNETLYDVAMESVQKLAMDKSIPRTDLIFVMHGLVDDIIDIVRGLQEAQESADDKAQE